MCDGWLSCSLKVLLTRPSSSAYPASLTPLRVALNEFTPGCSPGVLHRTRCAMLPRGGCVVMGQTFPPECHECRGGGPVGRGEAAPLTQTATPCCEASAVWWRGPVLVAGSSSPRHPRSPHVWRWTGGGGPLKPTAYLQTPTPHVGDAFVVFTGHDSDRYHSVPAAQEGHSVG